MRRQTYGYLPSCRASPPLAGTKLRCLVTEAHGCEQLAYELLLDSGPTGSRTHDRLIASPTPLRHQATLTTYLPHHFFAGGRQLNHIHCDARIDLPRDSLFAVKKPINDFSGSCLTVPLVFSPHCLHPETALLVLESDMQQSTLDQLLEQNVIHLQSSTVC